MLYPRRTLHLCSIYSTAYQTLSFVAMPSQCSVPVCKHLYVVFCGLYLSISVHVAISQKQNDLFRFFTVTESVLCVLCRLLPVYIFPSHFLSPRSKIATYSLLTWTSHNNHRRLRFTRFIRYSYPSKFYFLSSLLSWELTETPTPYSALYYLQPYPLLPYDTSTMFPPPLIIHASVVALAKACPSICPLAPS